MMLTYDTVVTASTNDIGQFVIVRKVCYGEGELSVISGALGFCRSHTYELFFILSGVC
jgi:hypothetical protein